MIEMGGERGSGRSMLAPQHDGDDNPYSERETSEKSREVVQQQLKDTVAIQNTIRDLCSWLTKVDK